jgi:hypothetical protein
MKKRYFVCARRWFDGINTYHSVCVTNLETGEEKVNPFEYGYGDAWQDTARRLMPLSEPKYWNNRHLRMSDLAHTDVVDVQRKKDLHNRGKQ